MKYQIMILNGSFILFSGLISLGLGTLWMQKIAKKYNFNQISSL